MGATNLGITLVRDIVLSNVIDEDELRTGQQHVAELREKLELMHQTRMREA